LFYLAARIAFAGAKISFIEAQKRPGIGAGILLQLINPKAYAVNTALFTSFLFAPDNFLFETGTKLIIMNMIWIPLHLIWLAAGVRLHRLNLSATTQRRVNIAMALSLVIVIILAVGSVFAEFSGITL
jgi:threonine/homoserine/homoserine lactone efflux protein